MQGVYLPCSFSCNCYAFSSFILLPAPQQVVNLRISIVIFLITLHNFLKYIYIYMISITYSFIKNLCSQYSIILLSTRIYEVRERGSEAEVSVKRDQLCRVDRLPNPSADLQWSGTTSSVWTAPKSVTCHFWSLFVATERARNGCQKESVCSGNDGTLDLTVTLNVSSVKCIETCKWNLRLTIVCNVACSSYFKLSELSTYIWFRYSRYLVPCPPFAHSGYSSIECGDASRCLACSASPASQHWRPRKLVRHCRSITLVTTIQQLTQFL